jgi:hypothetical protein
LLLSGKPRRPCGVPFLIFLGGRTNARLPHSAWACSAGPPPVFSPQARPPRRVRRRAVRAHRR